MKTVQSVIIMYKVLLPRHIRFLRIKKKGNQTIRIKIISKVYIKVGVKSEFCLKYKLGKIPNRSPRNLNILAKISNIQKSPLVHTKIIDIRCDFSHYFISYLLSFQKMYIIYFVSVVDNCSSSFFLFHSCFCSMNNMFKVELFHEGQSRSV